MIRDTSRAAYESLDLSAKQRAVMLKVHECYSNAEFTRKELTATLGWPINCVVPRVLELIDKGYLQELDARRDGGYLIRIRIPEQMNLELAA